MSEEMGSNSWFRSVQLLKLRSRVLMISSMCANSEAFVFLISNFRRAHQTSDHGLEAFDPVIMLVNGCPSC